MVVCRAQAILVLLNGAGSRTGALLHQMLFWAQCQGCVSFYGPRKMFKGRKTIYLASK
jgi:hypothetical protein